MAKGGNFEREFCKQLSLWWSKGESDAVFWRTSNSGGRATVRHRKGGQTKGQHGDVCATCVSGQPLIDALTIELKRGYSMETVANLLEKSKRKSTNQNTYAAWITKAQRSSEAAGTPYWMLVVRRDQREAAAYMPWRLFNAFKSLAMATSSPVTWKGNPRPLMTLELEDVKLVGMLLTDLLTWVDPALVPKLTGK